MAESNLRIVNYLDVTLNLDDVSFKPYNKPDDIFQYINKESDHFLSLISSLPAFIEKRRSKLYKESEIYYEDTLNKVGYTTGLVYLFPSAINQKNKNKNRQRNFIWVNPPCTKNVTTRIGQTFLYLIDTHFLKTASLTRYTRN